MRKVTLISTTLLLLSLALPVPALGSGLRVSPVSYTLNLQPGAEKAETIKITNTSNTIIELQIQPVEITFTNGVNVVSSDSAGAQMLKLDKDKVMLAPQEEIEINAQVTVPSNAAIGNVTLAAKLQWKQADATDAGTAGIIDPNALVLFKLNLLSQLPKTAVQVTKLEVPGFMLTNSTTISYEIKNNAAYFTKPIAYLQLVNSQGKPVWREVINESMALLNPGQTISGTSTATFEFNNPLDMGQYKVQLLVIDTQLSTQDILTGTTLFIHWIAIIVGVLVFVVLFALFHKLRKKYLVSSKPKFK